MTASHIDKTYESELANLREMLLHMSARVEEAMDRSVRAVMDRDSDRAQQVQKDDTHINVLEIEVDEACRRMLALRQPAASDLRFITTTLKIVVDLERMGDLAVNIAMRALDLNQAPALRPFPDLSLLANMGKAQARRALNAFVERDAQEAQEVMTGDDLMDALYFKVFNELLGFMMEDQRHIRRATALMFVAKHIERYGDHATNIAEMVIYLVRGKDVRHPRSRHLTAGA